MYNMVYMYVQQLSTKRIWHTCITDISEFDELWQRLKSWWVRILDQAIMIIDKEGIFLRAQDGSGTKDKCESSNWSGWSSSGNRRHAWCPMGLQLIAMQYSLRPLLAVTVITTQQEGPHSNLGQCEVTSQGGQGSRFIEVTLSTWHKQQMTFYPH